MSQQREKQLLAIIIVTHTVLALIFSLGPIFEGPDEIEHYRYVRILARTRQLPDPYSQPEGQLFQPPLYYAVASSVAVLVDDADFSEIDGRRNPYHGYLIGIPSNDNKNFYLHTRAEAFPYDESGTARAVHLMRLLSVAMGVGTITASYGIFRLLWPDRPDRRLAALGLVAFWPTFVYQSSVVTNDGLLALLVTVSLFLLIRQQRDGPSWLGATLLGAALGGALLTEVSAGLMVFPVGVATFIDRRTWRYAPLTLGVTLAVAGWWYGRNLMLYDDLFGLEALYATWPTDVIRAGGEVSLAVGLRQLPYAIPGFWARFGYGAVVVGRPIYVFFGALSVGGLLGAIVSLVGSGRTNSIGVRQGVIMGVAVLAWAGGAVLHASRVYTGNTGRQFLPAIAAWGALLAFGLDRWTPRRARMPVVLGGTAIMATIAAVSLFGYFLPAYRVASVPAAIDHPLDYRFDDAVELIGIEPSMTVARPGESVRITTYWRATGPTSTDLQTYLHSLDSEMVRHDSLPGSGSRLSTDWVAGETWAETNVLVIPLDAETQVAYSLVAGLYDPEADAALPARDGEGNTVTPIVGRLAVNGPATSLDTVYQFGEVIGMAEPRVVGGDGAAEVCLAWTSLATTPIDYTVFVHVLAGGDEPIAQADFQPKEGLYPTGVWTPGEVIEDCVRLDVSSDVPAADWQVGVGLYDLATGERLPVQGNDGDLLAGRMVIVQP